MPGMPYATKGPYVSHFPPGTSMQLTGLRARPELNGQEGTLVVFDTFKGRWSFEVDSTGEVLSVKEDNLELLGAREEPDEPMPDPD